MNSPVLMLCLRLFLQARIKRGKSSNTGSWGDKRSFIPPRCLHSISDCCWNLGGRLGSNDPFAESPGVCAAEGINGQNRVGGVEGLHQSPVSRVHDGRVAAGVD